MVPYVARGGGTNVVEYVMEYFSGISCTEKQFEIMIQRILPISSD